MKEARTVDRENLKKRLSELPREERIAAAVSNLDGITTDSIRTALTNIIDAWLDSGKTPTAQDANTLLKQAKSNIEALAIIKTFTINFGIVADRAVMEDVMLSHLTKKN